jgi:hypothetical protein
MPEQQLSQATIASFQTKLQFLDHPTESRHWRRGTRETATIQDSLQQRHAAQESHEYLPTPNGTDDVQGYVYRTTPQNRTHVSEDGQSPERKR